MDCPTFTEICNSAINWSDYGNSFSGIQTGLLMTDYLHPGKTTIMSVLCRSPQAETLTKVVTWECDFFVTTRQPRVAQETLCDWICSTEPSCIQSGLGSQWLFHDKKSKVLSSWNLVYKWWITDSCCQGMVWKARHRILFSRHKGLRRKVRNNTLRLQENIF